MQTYVKIENFDVSYDIHPLFLQGDTPETPTFDVESGRSISPPRTIKKRRNLDTLKEMLLDALNAYKDFYEARSAQYTDCVRTFGDMVMANLDEMDTTQQAQAMQSIVDVLMTIKMKREN